MPKKVTIAAKSLQRVRQVAKDLHTHNTTVHISKGSLIFEIGHSEPKTIIKLEDIKNGKANSNS